MKSLFAKVALFGLLLSTALLFAPQPAQSQSAVKIDLQLFDLKIDSVNALYIRPVGAPFRDSTNTAKVKVYYELRRKSGKTAEIGNWDLPLTIYAYINDYVLGTVTGSTINTINAFFQAADLPELIAIMPEPTE